MRVWQEDLEAMQNRDTARMGFAAGEYAGYRIIRRAGLVIGLPSGTDSNGLKTLGANWAPKLHRSRKTAPQLALSDATRTLQRSRQSSVSASLGNSRTNTFFHSRKVDARNAP